MDNIKVGCLSCNVELVSTSKVQCCGCPNMMRVVDNKVSAVDLTKVVMLNSISVKNNKTFLTQEDVMWQEARKQRKVRKLNFEVR